MHTLLRKFIDGSLLALALVFVQAPAAAVPILTLDLDASAVNLAPGRSATVTGTITNRSNTPLSGMDFILNFAAYDPTAIEPTQLLGTTAVTIPAFTFRDGLDLFSISVLPDAIPGMYSLDVLLQDVHGNLADPVSMRIVVSGAGTAVPEPGTLYLVLACLALLAALHRQPPAPLACEGD